MASYFCASRSKQTSSNKKIELDGETTSLYFFEKEDSSNNFYIDFNDTNPFPVLNYLFETKKFNKPHLILKIDGTASKLNLKIIEEFKQQMAKVASNSGAWIFTECEYKDNLLGLIEDALIENCDTENIPLICFDRAASLRKRIIEDFQLQTTLSVQEIYGKLDIKLCKKFFILSKNEPPCNQIMTLLRKNLPITAYKYELHSLSSHYPVVLPTTLIFIQGHLDQIKVIYNAIKSEIPVLLITGTGGIADLIKFLLNNSFCCNDEDIYCERCMLNKIIHECHDYKNLQFNQQEIENKIKDLKALLLICKNRPNCIIFYDFENIGDSFDTLILTSIQKSIKDANPNQIEFILKMNAKKFFEKNEVQKDFIKVLGSYTQCQLENLVEVALLTNNYIFIEVLMNMNIFDWNKFLTVQRLYMLYNSDKILESKRNRGFITAIGDTPINFSTVKKFLRKNSFKNFDTDILPNDVEEYVIQRIVMVDDELTKEPLQNLFLWSILFQNFELAEIFWFKGESHISIALFASRVLNSLLKTLDPDLQSRVSEQSKKLEKMAVTVMDFFDQNTNSFMNSIFLLNTSSFSKNIHNLQMAVECKSRDFIAQTTVQKFLTDIWYCGIKEAYDGFWWNLWAMFKMLACILSFGLVALIKTKHFSVMEEPYEIRLIEREKHVWNMEKEELLKGDFKNFFNRYDPEKSEKDNKFNKQLEEFYERNKKYFNKKCLFKICLSTRSHFIEYLTFFKAPITHYSLNMVTSIIFLALLTHILLNGFNKITLPLPIFLTVWVMLIFWEELKQVKKNRINKYIEDNWNKVDLFGCSSFLIGIIICFVGIICRNHKLDNEVYFVISRIVLTISLITWCIRFLHFFLIHESLGPKLVMIWNMVKDVRAFILILVVFLYSFGISTQINLHVNEKLGFLDIIHRIVQKAFWPIFGEIIILHSDLKENCTSNNSEHFEECVKSSGTILSYILLIIYMIIANVLLLNLLIAIFNSTYQKIEEKSSSIWKYQRYKLILEYIVYSYLPPPLNIFELLWTIITCVREFLVKFKENCNKVKNILQNRTEKPRKLLIQLERKFAYDTWLKIKKEEKEKRKDDKS